MVNGGREPFPGEAYLQEKLSAVVLDPPPVATPRHVGPLLLLAYDQDRLVKLVDAAVPMRGRAQLTHGEVIAALPTSAATSAPTTPRSMP